MKPKNNKRQISNAETYASLKTKTEKGVAFVTIDNPPLNNLNAQLVNNLMHFAKTVEKDELVKVIVFDSADEEFFIPMGDS